MRPDEEPRVGDAVQPPHRIRDDRVGPPLTRAAVDGTRFGTARSRAGVFVESSIQTASRRQHDRSNEGGGPEAACSVSASVAWPAATALSALSRTPCLGGKRPVKRLVCAVSVSGATDVARSNTTPSRASRSSAGIGTSMNPYGDNRSARVVSSVIMTTLKLGTIGAVAAHQNPVMTTPADSSRGHVRGRPIAVVPFVTAVTLSLTSRT